MVVGGLPVCSGGWGLLICDIRGKPYKWTKKSVSQQGTVYIGVMIKILFEFDCFFTLQDDVVCKKSNSFLSGELITGFIKFSASDNAFLSILFGSPNLGYQLIYLSLTLYGKHLC